MNELTAKSEQMLRLQMNLDIFCTKDIILDIIDELDDLFQELKNYPDIYYHKKTIVHNLEPMKFVIMDLEGYFPKLCGLLIGNTIFQFYIKEERYQYEFYKVIFEVLKRVKEFYIFTFSNWESYFISVLKNELKSAIPLKELCFLEHLSLINIQNSYYESLTAGLFSLGEEVVSDPVLRISDNIDLLFDMGYSTLIIKHNTSCLKSTLKLLKRRFFQLNLISPQSTYTHMENLYKYSLIIHLNDTQRILFDLIT